MADNADVYAFVSPDNPNMVTIFSNFVPLQGPAGGPNFYEFGDDVLYSIYIDNDSDAQPEIEYQFRFHSSLRNNNTFLYNTGPIGSLGDANWNARQFYSVTRIDAGPGHGPPGPPPGPPPGGPAKAGPAWPSGPTHATVLGTNLPCPPCNIGPHSTPDYENKLGSKAVLPLPGGGRSSPASGTTRSSSTSAGCSTCSICGRSSRTSRSAASRSRGSTPPSS